MVSAMFCCHLAWALLVVLCALTLPYGSCQDKKEIYPIEEISLGAPYQEFDDEFRIRLIDATSEEFRFGAIVGKTPAQTKDGSFSMEIQYKVKHMSQQLGGNIELAIQLTDGETRDQGHWIANADIDFNGFAIVMTSHLVPGYEEYTSQKINPHHTGGRTNYDDEDEEITVALLYRDRSSRKIQHIGSCTANATFSDAVHGVGSTIGIFESSGLRLQYLNSERRVMLMIDEDYHANWRTCVVGTIEGNKQGKLLETMRLSLYATSASTYNTVDLINARVWDTAHGAFDSPPFGFGAKRVLDVHDPNERIILLANTFEHTIMEMKMALQIYTKMLNQIVERDVERISRIEDMLNQGFLAQVEERMAAVETTLMDNATTSYGKKLEVAQESAHNRIKTKGGELAESKDTILMLGAFAWKTLTGGEKKASYGGVL